MRYLNCKFCSGCNKVTIYQINKINIFRKWKKEKKKSSLQTFTQPNMDKIKRAVTSQPASYQNVWFMVPSKELILCLETEHFFPSLFL